MGRGCVVMTDRELRVAALEKFREAFGRDPVSREDFERLWACYRGMLKFSVLMG